MVAGIRVRRGETVQHVRLKRLAFLWAQAHGFSACAMEVSLPKCRYRADVAAYRCLRRQSGLIGIFECKQALCDLRRDNCNSEPARQHLDAICKRRQILETHLRTHYPTLRNGDSLFPEFDTENFDAIGHRGYGRLLRDLRRSQHRLYDCTKFEKLIRYRCANLFFLVLPEKLFREQEVPVGWGALVESNGSLTLTRKPLWHDTTFNDCIRVLQRIAIAGTRAMNRQFETEPNEIRSEQSKSIDDRSPTR